MTLKSLSLLDIILIITFSLFGDYLPSDLVLPKVYTPTITEKSVLQTTDPKKTYVVSKVVDGDTIVITDGMSSQRVRLIGIDTPETVDPRRPVECFGKEASEKMKELILGKKVNLISDPTQGEKDKYQRLLRYVYLEDGLFINQTMIEKGFAFEYTYKTPYKYQKEFKDAEVKARNGGVGLWGNEACPNE